ncbi:MAG: putative molybdenum carrier protein [Pseudomonadota bacterium]
MRPPARIVSGGQTGADRAALDWALAHGIACGGWCPRGRRAEDGAIDPRYPLTEMPADDYAQRTEWNVRDSDATVIVSLAPVLTGGSRLTRELAAKLGRPCLHLHPGLDAPRLLAGFVADNAVQVLNVAGPRASGEPDVYRYVMEVLDAAFQER